MQIIFKLYANYMPNICRLYVNYMQVIQSLRRFLQVRCQKKYAYYMQYMCTSYGDYAIDMHIIHRL